MATGTNLDDCCDVAQHVLQLLNRLFRLRKLVPVGRIAGVGGLGPVPQNTVRACGEPALGHAHLALHDEQQLVHDLALHPALNLVHDVRPRLLVGYKQQHAWDLLSALIGLDADNVLRELSLTLEVLFPFLVAFTHTLLNLSLNVRQVVHRCSRSIAFLGMLFPSLVQLAETR